MAHTVAQRTHEIGLRVALGAQPAQVRAMVLRQAGVLVAAGVAIGLGSGDRAAARARCVAARVCSTASQLSQPVLLGGVAIAVTVDRAARDVDPGAPRDQGRAHRRPAERVMKRPATGDLARRHPAGRRAAALADRAAGIGKRFRVDEVETRRARGHRSRDPARRAGLDQRPVGLGQVDAAGDPRPARDAERAACTGSTGSTQSTLAQTALAALRNRSIGFIFQSFNLIADLTRRAQRRAAADLRRRARRRERKQRVAEALELVKLGHLAHQMPGRLSGGQQQRVAVARAIADDPPILLADEPTGNLDSKHGDDVIGLLQRMHARGATVCLVTHNPDYERLATRMLHMLDGRIVDDSGA